MTEQEILTHNVSLRQKQSEIYEKINELQLDYATLSDKMIAPFEFCKYDGQFRCEMCMERGYEGFNISYYPYVYDSFDSVDSDDK
mgnify:CR=1 FL=1